MAHNGLQLGKTTNLQGIYRAIKLRFAPKNKNNVFELTLQLDKKIAFATARQIGIDYPLKDTDALRKHYKETKT